MRVDRAQPAREPLARRCPPGQPFPVEGPNPPGDHREQRRTRPLPETPEERPIRLPRRNRPNRAVDQTIEVGAEPRTETHEQAVGPQPRVHDETECHQ